jgi:hypothetical protein
VVVGKAASGRLANGTMLGVEPASVGVIAVLGVVGTGDELPPLFVGISTGPITGDDGVGVAPVGK